jgi:hypothetical protein
MFDVSRRDRPARASRSCCLPASDARARRSCERHHLDLRQAGVRRCDRSLPAGQQRLPAAGLLPRRSISPSDIGRGAAELSLTRLDKRVGEVGIAMHCVPPGFWPATRAPRWAWTSPTFWIDELLGRGCGGGPAGRGSRRPLSVNVVRCSLPPLGRRDIGQVRRLLRATLQRRCVASPTSCLAPLRWSSSLVRASHRRAGRRPTSRPKRPARCRVAFIRTARGPRRGCRCTRGSAGPHRARSRARSSSGFRNRHP